MSFRPWIIRDGGADTIWAPLIVNDDLADDLTDDLTDDLIDPYYSLCSIRSTLLDPDVPRQAPTFTV